MATNIKASLNFYPCITLEDFKGNDERFQEALKNMMGLLDGLYIKYEYVTAEAHIGNYEKEVEIGLHLQDLGLTFVWPTLGKMGLRKQYNSLNILDLDPDSVDTIYDLHKFLNGQDLSKI